MEKVHPKSHGPNDSEGLPIQAIHHIEFYVGNARQASHFYCRALGFTPIAYAGLETGARDRESVVLGQGTIRLVLTSATCSDSPIAEHVKRHGDGVKDIALQVSDARRAFEYTVSRGARAMAEPATQKGDGVKVTRASIGVYGETVHTFVERQPGGAGFLPEFKSAENSASPRGFGLAAIDHVAVSVEKGSLVRWVDFYKHIFGFHQSHQEDVETEYSAMNSMVVQSANGRVKFPIMEPASGKKKSQIEEYLNYYDGPGAQHIALLSDNIIGTVRVLRSNGVEFLNTPPAYYERLEERVGGIEEDINELRQLNILADRDGWGYLLQIFSKPLQSRPTLFMEIIQRNGSRGFGGGNIKALYESLEREQAMRANL